MGNIEKNVKCPICKENVFKFIVGKGFYNDRGGLIIEMDKCGHKFSYKCINPDEAYIDGGKILDTWDDDLNDEFEIKEKYSLQNSVFSFETLMFIPTEKPQFPKYELDEYPLYYDDIKKINFEKKAYQVLEKKMRKVSDSFNNYLNYFLKGKGGNPKYVYIILKISENRKALFYREFNERINFYDDLHHTLLADIQGIDIEDFLEGTFTKSESLSLLRKCILRWNILFQHILIFTPFVGHQWNKKEEIFELWENLIFPLQQSKTTLITRTSTMNKFKKVSKELGFDIELLKSFDVTIPIIENYIKKQDFHAKFYGGISDNGTEILSGSVNVLEGPSIENFVIKRGSLERFKVKYLEKMKIMKKMPDIKPDKCDILIIEEKENGRFICNIEKQKLDAREIISSKYK